MTLLIMFLSLFFSTQSCADEDLSDELTAEEIEQAVSPGTCVPYYLIHNNMYQDAPDIYDEAEEEADTLTVIEDGEIEYNPSIGVVVLPVGLE